MGPAQDTRLTGTRLDEKQRANNMLGGVTASITTMLAVTLIGQGVFAENDLGSLINGITNGATNGATMPTDISSVVEMLRGASDDEIKLFAQLAGVNYDAFKPAADFLKSLTDEQVKALEDGVNVVSSTQAVPINDILDVFGYDPLDNFSLDYWRNNIYNAIEDEDVKTLVDGMDVDAIINGADFDSMFKNGVLDLNKLQTALNTLDLSAVPTDKISKIANDIDYTKLYKESELQAFLPATELLTNIGWVHGLYYVTVFKSATKPLAQFSFLYENDPWGFWTCFDKSFAIDDKDLAAIASGGEGLDCASFTSGCDAEWVGVMDGIITSQATNGASIGCPDKAACMQHFSYACYVNALTASSDIEVGIQKGVMDTLECVMIGTNNKNWVDLNVIVQAAAKGLFGPAFVAASLLNFGVVPELRYSADSYTEVAEFCTVDAAGAYNKNAFGLTQALRTVFNEDPNSGNNAANNQDGDTDHDKKHGFQVGAAGLTSFEPLTVIGGVAIGLFAMMF